MLRFVMSDTADSPSGELASLIVRASERRETDASLAKGMVREELKRALA